MEWISIPLQWKHLNEKRNKVEWPGTSLRSLLSRRHMEAEKPDRESPIYQRSLSIEWISLQPTLSWRWVQSIKALSAVQPVHSACILARDHLIKQGPVQRKIQCLVPGFIFIIVGGFLKALSDRLILIQAFAPYAESRNNRFLSCPLKSFSLISDNRIVSNHFVNTRLDPGTLIRVARERERGQRGRGLNHREGKGRHQNQTSFGSDLSRANSFNIFRYGR